MLARKIKIKKVIRSCFQAWRRFSNLRKCLILVRAFFLHKIIRIHNSTSRVIEIFRTRPPMASTQWSLRWTRHWITIAICSILIPCTSAQIANPSWTSRLLKFIKKTYFKFNFSIKCITMYQIRDFKLRFGIWAESGGPKVKW